MLWLVLDEREHFVELGHDRGGQVLQQFQNGPAIRQAAAGDLAHDERMHQHRRTLEQFDKPSITSAQVIHPH